MNRDLLRHLPVVLVVARRRGFSAAAAELGMTPSAVSHAVRAVEEHVGQPLFARTTRSVALTEAGAALVAAVGPALASVAEGIERLAGGAGQPQGRLRLNVPRVALSTVVVPVLEAMRKRHPGVVVEVYGDDGITDIVAAGFDAGIRLGEMIAEDMIAVRLTPPFKAIVVASPAYLRRRGEPQRIADLAEHECIGYRQVSGGGLYCWELRDGRADVAVQTPSSIIVNDATIALGLAKRGLGLAYVFEPLARAELRRGRLRQVLVGTEIEEPGLFLYFPARGSRAPKLRAFIDVAREVLSGAG